MPQELANFGADSLNGYLCNLIAANKCSLIYQLDYQAKPTQSAIQSSLQIAPATVNCSVEAYLIDTHQVNIDDRYGGFSYADSLIKNDMYTNQSKVSMKCSCLLYSAGKDIPSTGINDK